MLLNMMGNAYFTIRTSKFTSRPDICIKTANEKDVGNEKDNFYIIVMILGHYSPIMNLKYMLCKSSLGNISLCSPLLDGTAGDASDWIWYLSLVSPSKL
ncbi:hypothetical protein C0J52_28077 [Blattella germanica]|nr:hypothetical protein C0J52_28077 [Blattella germanica]